MAVMTGRSFTHSVCTHVHMKITLLFVTHDFEHIRQMVHEIVNLTENNKLLCLPVLWLRNLDLHIRKLRY